MVNEVEFSKRLEKIMQYYNRSAASFAEAIAVGRSSISHILSGRNKPSLEFVMKIIEAFPEVDLYWLLNGTGDFPKRAAPSTQNKIPVPPPGNSSKTTANLFSVPSTPTIEKKTPLAPPTVTNRKLAIIDRIVVFYTDGTFDSYTEQH